jgi:hypothetical protein
MIGRSSTGTYHHVAGAASACNGRSFRGSTIATADLIDRAPEEMFCRKCFNINARDKTRKGNALFIFNRDKAGA